MDWLEVSERRDTPVSSELRQFRYIQLVPDKFGIAIIDNIEVLHLKKDK